MISLLLATAAAVQAPEAAEKDSEEVVVTATGAPQSRAEAGQAITVVTRAELERRQTVSLADYLATTPGVVVTRNGGPGNFTGVRIRGAEAEQTLTLIDGVRVNDPSSPGGSFDFGNLLAGGVERVEVLRGANSVAWGSQAIGGIVNVVTEQPVDGVRVRAAGEYGYRDSGYATASLAAGSDRVRGSVGGGYFTTDGISTAATGTERDGYRQYGGTAKLVVEPTPGIGADVRLYYADSRVRLDGFPPPAFRFTDTAEYSTAREVYGYAGLFADLAGGRFRNRIAFTLADVNRDNFNPAVGTAATFSGRGRSERYEYRGDFALADAVRLVGGAEREDSRFDDLAGTRAATGITSFYGQAILTPLPRVTLTAGVRRDEHEDFGGKTTLGGNAAVGLGGGTVLRATYAEGFKAPTLFQLFSTFGTPTLQPETAKSYDIGVEQALGARARIGATWFGRRTVNQIDFDLGTFTYANIARTRAEGVELTGELRPSDRLTVQASYSHIASRNRSPGANLGKQLARRPRDSASVSADWTSPWGPSLGGTITLVGDSFDDAGNFTRLDGYVLAGVRAELPVGDRFALYGRVDNVFDAKYQTVAGYGTYGRAAYVGVRARLK